MSPAPALVDAGAVLDQSDDHALALVAEIAGELGRALILGDVEPDVVRRLRARALPGGARGRLLLGHGGVEAGAVDAEALGAQRVLGEVVGEAERVVELEGGGAGERVARLHRAGRLVEQPQAIVEGLAEAGLLQLQRLLDQRLGADQLGIGRAHLGDEARHEPVHQRLGRAEQMGVAHRPAHDPPQHIAPALVRRQHAVGDQEARRAQMIGDDPVADVVGRVGPGQLGRGLDQRPERVGVEHVVDALQHRRDALQAHAGVDRLLGQVADDLIVLLLILHEDEVPDLDEAVAILVRASRAGRRGSVAMIEEDLRAGPARAAVAHRPEIVLGGDADDALVGQAGDLLPQVPGLVVGMIDGDGEPVRAKAPIPS